jgi:lipopolysaccharide transport system permease protein
MSRSLAEVIRRRDVLYALTWREIRVRYKQSVMGVLWAILMPLVILSAGLVVRFGFSMVTGEPLRSSDLASVSVRAVPWAFFVASLRFATSSLIANTPLLTKIYLPREIFPAATIIAQLVDFAVSGVVLAIVLIALGVGVSIQVLWVPVLVALLVVLVTGLGILLSAAALFFRDVKYLVEVFLTFAIFFTPVLYEARMFGRWEDLLLLNPVAPILEGFAAVLVRHEPPALGWLAYSAAFGTLTLAGALYAFRRLEPYFAESV